MLNFKRCAAPIIGLVILALQPGFALAQSDYTPDDSVLQRMKPYEARKRLGDFSATISSCAFCDGIAVGQFHVENSNTLVLEGLNDKRMYSFPLDKLSLKVEVYGLGTGVRIVLADGWTMWGWSAQGFNSAKELADIIYVLRQSAAGDGAQANGTDFNQVVSDYLKADPKPEISEDVRRFKVQAESAVRAKQFEDAADLYGEALKLAPWWPYGHFNRSLLLAEVGRYREAVTEMNRYLQLVPDASNARAAKDKVYEWELKLPPGSVGSADTSDTVTVNKQGAQDYQACVQAIQNAPDYQVFKKHVFSSPEQATPEQLADASFASDEEIAAIVHLHPKMKACEAQFIALVTATSPSLGAMTALSLTKVEYSLTDLIQRKKTWGDHNRFKIDIAVKLRSDMNAQKQRLQAQPNQDPAVELQQKQAAADALAQFVQAQQTINAMSH